jgi:threonine/homoserine/homoserine lactone efflux protein
MLATGPLLALAVYALVSSATPGPNNLMLMASGTNFGFARSWPHMFGVALGFVVMLLVVGSGVGFLIQSSPRLALALKVASVVYMIYLAWKIATAPPPSAAVRADARPLTFLQAAAFQWINPRGWAMALTAAAVYVPQTDRVVGLIEVALVFGIINLPVVSLWTAIGVQLRRLLDRPRTLRAFNVTTALLLVGSLYPTVAMEA